MTSTLLTYIDFINAFGVIDHTKLLALMEDLGYPNNAIELICNIYRNSTTTFHNNHFIATTPFYISKGAIHIATLNPYIFVIFLYVVLQCFDKIK